LTRETYPTIAILVAHDSAAVLPACLDSLRREGLPAIVVDNASGDGSALIAESCGARLVRNSRNEGYGRAMNIGLRESARLAPSAEAGGEAKLSRMNAARDEARARPSPREEDHVGGPISVSESVDAGGRETMAGRALCLLLNPDIVLEPGCVAALLEAAARYPDAVILAPRLVEADGRFFFQPRSLLSPYLRNEVGAPCLPQGDCCAPFLSGACLLVERDFILSLGGFDELIFLFYEDDDLCRRVIDAGRSLVHVDGALARHARGGSTHPSPGRVFKARWHMAWSAGYVAGKYGLTDPSWRTLLVNALKFCGAALTLNRALTERYGGSAAGALAWLRGKGALEQEGLP
jgi:N-acetylglucosaminyl-diphospho-decaprenol L-rhamnosyltransferase